MLRRINHSQKNKVVDKLKVLSGCSEFNTKGAIR